MKTRCLIKLDKKLLNEAAKTGYAMTDFGNMLLKSFREAGLDAIFRLKPDTSPCEFEAIEISFPKGSHEQ